MENNNLKNNTMKIYYDTESDYLEIIFGELTECHYKKIGPDAFVRIDEKTGEVRGYAIYNVKKNDSPLKSINVDTGISFKPLPLGSRRFLQNRHEIPVPKISNKPHTLVCGKTREIFDIPKNVIDSVK